uniref:BIG2 domain-containing protein n=1 Tax=Pseudomonas phage RVTF4 TaxID=3236931 RepID=A0AB39CCK7_9VIRU
MAVLKLQEAVDARVALDITPVEERINDHLKTQRVVDYVTNPEIANPNLQVNADGVQLTKAAQEALKASIEAAEWKSVEVKQNAKGVIVTFSKNEKTVPGGPDVYVATPTKTQEDLKVGDKATIGLTVTKNGQPYTGTPTFRSNKTNIATVSATGEIEAIAIGSAVITISEGEFYSVTVNVTVTAA